MDRNLTVIIQAGGRGSRLRHFSWNKPKCLVSVNGRPILYHFFLRFPEAKFVIIGDYLFDTLETYLSVNEPTVEYKLVKASGAGTLSGIKQALEYVNSTDEILIAWSDLKLHEDTELQSFNSPKMFVTDEFKCRWHVDNDDKLLDEPSNTRGILGLFGFPNKSYLKDVPDNGEFVRWLSNEEIPWDVKNITNAQELGNYSDIEKNNARGGFCRFFNSVEIKDDVVVKTVLDPNYDQVHEREVVWYFEVKRLGFRRIPEVISTDPLVMKRVMGAHPFELTDLTMRERRSIITDSLEALQSLHSLDSVRADMCDVKSVYIDKTKSRVREIQPLLPFFDKPYYTVNGVKCRNVFHKDNIHIFDDIQKELDVKAFHPIHGDPTFSNTLIDDSLRAIFIDPRGYFSKPNIYGDVNYDFAKLYYSVVGGYDEFNRRNFKLHIDEQTAELLSPEPMFKTIAEPIFKEFFPQQLPMIKVLHGLIWLALTGYAKDDIDSVLGAFYAGLYWLEDGMSEL